MKITIDTKDPEEVAKLIRMLQSLAEEEPRPATLFSSMMEEPKKAEPTFDVNQLLKY